MTLFANRDEHTGNVKVQCTYGPTSFAVDEDPRSARAFHGQLGRLLDEVEGRTPEQRARDAHGRFAASVVAAGGSEQPAFDEQPDEIRQHWIAALTE